MTSELFSPLRFTSGACMQNRFALAPLTNTQSHEDGRLSEDEYRWLTLRARGGFGLTMTCASHVQAVGKGFPGQLGCFSDAHTGGLRRLAAGIRSEGSLAVVQLHHAGMRAPADLVDARPVCPSEHVESGSRALTGAEVEQVRDDFVEAALRAERAGFDGVELHGAHGYLLCQFLSPEINARTDRYGGSLENRSRLLFEIAEGVRARCRPGFLLGVRLSPERFGMRLEEVREVAIRLAATGWIDFLDMSLWDSFKEPARDDLRGQSLMSYFTDFDRGDVRLGVAGKIDNGPDARRCVDAGADFVIIGRGGILHHDFPRRVEADPSFTAAGLPVSADHLRKEGLGDAFIDYMAGWKGFVKED